MNPVTVKNANVAAEEKIFAKKDKEKETGAVYVLNDELKAFLNLHAKPARWNGAQTAAYLGFKPHDIPVLAARGFLKPLGCPAQNCEKYFARTKVQTVAEDEEWLSRATAALSQHWRGKNARKS